MGNTADLAMVQKTIIDTLHKEGKSQRVITERGGCSMSAVSKHIKSILAPTHRATTTSKWFADHDITVLDWPANMPDLNPIWNLWDIFKRKMRNSQSNNPDELKAQ